MYVRVPDLTVQLASLHMCFSLEECSVVVFSAVMTLLPYLHIKTHKKNPLVQISVVVVYMCAELLSTDIYVEYNNI